MVAYKYAYMVAAQVAVCAGGGCAKGGVVGAARGGCAVVMIHMNLQMICDVHLGAYVM
jgi:hypothetical protein